MGFFDNKKKKISAQPKAAAEVLTGQRYDAPGGSCRLGGILNLPIADGELGRLRPEHRYRVLSVLGKGGMGAVFEAQDTKLISHIALKVMLQKVAENPKR